MSPRSLKVTYLLGFGSEVLTQDMRKGGEKVSESLLSSVPPPLLLPSQADDWHDAAAHMFRYDARGTNMYASTLRTEKSVGLHLRGFFDLPIGLVHVVPRA